MYLAWSLLFSTRSYISRCVQQMINLWLSLLDTVLIEFQGLGVSGQGDHWFVVAVHGYEVWHLRLVSVIISICVSCSAKFLRVDVEIVGRVHLLLDESSVELLLFMVLLVVSSQQHHIVENEVALQILSLMNEIQTFIFWEFVNQNFAKLVLEADDLFTLVLRILVWNLLRVILQTCKFEQLHNMLILSWTTGAHLVQLDDWFFFLFKSATTENWLSFQVYLLGPWTVWVVFSLIWMFLFLLTKVCVLESWFEAI